MTKTELKENITKIEQLLQSENFEAGFEHLKTLNDPELNEALANLIRNTVEEILIPENYNNFLSKFFASDVGNNRGAVMRISPFDDEFYKDLFNIFKDENNVVYTEIYVSVSGNFDGAYEESVTFKKHGH